ncbi:MAG: hypothetical protein ACJ8G7_07455 [Rhizobacter sp.]
MKAAIGFKPHSGWAAVVVVGRDGGSLHLVERSRIALVDEPDDAWARQPYHAAEPLPRDDAVALVQRGIRSAHAVALRETRRLLDRLRSARHEVSACGVIVGRPMPDWTTEQILAVHIRMHQAEGALFPDALAQAAAACGLAVVRLADKDAEAQAAPFMAEVAALGRSAGPPWGRDQKVAALAALLALQNDHPPLTTRLP